MIWIWIQERDDFWAGIISKYSGWKGVRLAGDAEGQGKEEWSLGVPRLGVWVLGAEMLAQGVGGKLRSSQDPQPRALWSLWCGSWPTLDTQ